MNTKKLRRVTLFILFCVLSCAIPASAQHFRVTLNGFQAVRLTNEGVTDGDGDEIRFISDAVTLDSSGAFKILPQVSGSVISVARPGCRPGSCVWRLTGPVVGADPLPLVLFDGNITPGSPAIIIPTIWEMDSNPSWNLLSTYSANLAASGPDLQTRLNAFISAPPPLSIDSVRRPASGLGFNNSTMLLAGGWPQDRPIGVTETAHWNQYDFTPKGLVLTPQLAEFISRTDTGFGPGVVEVTYDAENGFMAGSYRLYLQVDRLPDPCPERPLTSTFTGESELRTTHMNAPGPFFGHVSLTATFNPCRTTVQISNLVPIVSSPTRIPPPDGPFVNITTTTQIGTGMGMFNPPGGPVRVPITLHIEHSLATEPVIGLFFQPSDLSLILEGSAGADGNFVLTGSGPFNGGALHGTTGTLRVTGGSFSPRP